MPENETQPLSRTTVVNYRSRLKMLRSVVTKLEGEDQVKAQREIDVLEVKLGPYAQAERRPGRPKTRVEVPEEVKQIAIRTADQPWSEAAKRERLKAKMAKLKASLIETEGQLVQQEETTTEFDEVNQKLQEVINAEVNKEAVKGGDTGNGRTSDKSEPGTGGTTTTTRGK